MKLLLINPPRSPHNGILEFAPEQARHFIHKKLIGPPLGLITLAAACREYEVHVLDMKGEYDLNPAAPAPAALAAAHMEQIRPDVVGVTFIASEFPAGMDILRTVKRIEPGVLTVAGGLHATVCPADFAGGAADIVVPGQGAGTFVEIIHARAKRTPLDAVPEIFIKSDDGLKFTGNADRSWEPAGRDFVFPDRSHLKRWISTYRAGGSPDTSTYLFTSLGCPYRCTFCSIWNQFGGRFHQRDVESVIRELQMIDEYPVVRFADANTIVNEAFMSRLFDRIREEGIRKTFIMDVRFDTAARFPALIEKLARNGLKVVICGFESFREEELRRYRKEAQAGLIEKAISVFHANGIMVRGNYVIPADYTKDDFAAMADYAGSHRVVYAGYTILTPMPGSPLYDEMKDRIVDTDLAKYNFFNSVMKTALPIEQFYENVGRLWLIKEGTDVI
ncbi:MAG TPA: radical SAM protein [Spirochaetota bacterium]|nr:B12-binding domain-containing radical SAM protein [Spirochaetota bacterium]HOD15697.1 radical SAM protein [Spirochaetota bacterium]HPG49871.1 radical SAM protein [Spirochaetota bacterium]HPN12533.1 radical SAM protein [Spirochaetota bacterium]